MRVTVLSVSALSALSALAVLSACATTPRQQCEFPLRSELANVRDEIRASELLLKRGFRLEPVTEPYGLHFCIWPNDAVVPCTNEEDGPMFDKFPINERAEMAKLETLRLGKARIEAALAACAVQFPE